MAALPATRILDSRPFGLGWNVVRVAVALSALSSIGYLYVSGSDRPTFNPGNFFSFFTIQSNIFAAAVLLYVALRGASGRSTAIDYVRGAATLYMAITGVVFAVLLSGMQESLNTAEPWADFAVHKLMPIVLVLDWLVDPPGRRLPLGTAVLWLLYPLLYVVYTLIRGPFADWYPYPFVDVDRHGYAGVAWRCVVLAVGMLAAAALVVAAGNWLGGRRGAALRPDRQPGAQVS